MKKTISILLLLTILYSSINVKASANRSIEPWSIDIESIALTDELYTEETVVNYDGS